MIATVVTRRSAIAADGIIDAMTERFYA